jgi:hypothetical protein
MTGKQKRRQRLHDHLNAALDNLLAALVAIGGLPPVAPEEALDAALATDAGYQKARGRFA